MSDPSVRYHEQWLGMVQPVEGLVVSIPVLVEAQVEHRHDPSFQQGFREHLEIVGDALRIRDVSTFLRAVLGWTNDQLIDSTKLPRELELYVPEGKQTLQPSFGLKKAAVGSSAIASDDTPASIAGRDYAALIWEIDDGVPLDTASLATGSWEYPPDAKFDRLLRQCRVPIGLLTNRRDVRLIYAPHGASSGSITFRIADMASIGGRPILDAFVALLSAYRFFGAAADHQLPKILSDSRKRQVSVTNTLATQVFEAAQILLAGFEAAADRDTRYRSVLAEALMRGQDHVYGGLLTVLLRLVFVLYSEDRGLLPISNPIYARAFSVLGLFDELQNDQATHPDTMTRRFGAWPRLIALFRTIFLGGSHGDFTIPERRGELFDPHTYAFLEGWGPLGSAPITTAEAREAVAVPRIDDGTIYAVLERLVMLEGQRLSYRALDVEQIGSVYEALMGYHVERTSAPAICLKPETAKAVWLSVDELLAVAKGQRAKWLQDDVGLSKSSAAKINEAVSACADANAAFDALQKHRARGTEPRGAGRLLIQPGQERRRTSSHYTPRILSAPIVARTLDPLIKVMGNEPSSERLLNLKICDPAMGSGAFLVEACRYLGDQLVAAWTREKRLDKVADLHEDVVTHARRLVAQRCLYGVDKNAFAVSLAKLSLWLVTLSKNEPFSFVDHALRHGDSLVGLDFTQITSFHWNPSKQKELFASVLKTALDDAISARQNILALADSSATTDTREKYRLLDDATDALDRVRLIGDLVVGAFFSSISDKERERERLRRLQLVNAWLASDTEAPPELRLMQQQIRDRFPVFHWMAEFPEIFHAERPDPLAHDEVNRVALMDAVVGNPPFAGKNGIADSGGSGYLEWLQTIHDGAHGNSDLSAHFFRRADALLGEHGTLGLIATNTIAQGDTRATGLQWQIAQGAEIYFAKRSMPWPGDAAVSVSVVHLAKGNVRVVCPERALDDVHVPAINSRLRGTPERTDPVVLASNTNCAYVGSYVLGMGFTLTTKQRDELIAKDPRNSEHIFPYLGGEELNTSPTQSHDRYVINFGDMTLQEAARWPDLLRIVREEVKPERDRNNRESYKKYWWHFGEKRPALYEAIRLLPRCLVTARVTKHLCFSFQPTTGVLNEKIFAFTLVDYSPLSILQSRVHAAWTWLLSSTMKTDLNYAASDCFDTFPFPSPEPRAIHPKLEQIGERLNAARNAYMIANNVGLTGTYNRLKDPDVITHEIEALRELHRAMDRAVLDAYGWSTIAVPPFTTPRTEAEKRELETFSDAVIDSLFLLNEQRAKAELLTGQANAPVSQKRPRTAKKAVSAKTGTLALDGESKKS